MIYLEDLTETILAEEGQTLLGLDFLTDTLKFGYDKMEKIFIKSAMEYGKRKPFHETIDDTTGGQQIKLPSSTISVQAIRYGILPQLPKFYLPTWGDESYELVPYTFNSATKVVTLKVWPPMYPIRVTLNRHYTITNTQPITQELYTFDGNTEIVDYLPCTYKPGTLKITKGEFDMVETGRGSSKVKRYDGTEETVNVAELRGSLGTGLVNLDTREITLELDADADTTETPVLVDYYPKYKCILELDNSDYVFTKLYASKILEALASLRAQATQEDLHNIDLTVDDLYARVRILKKDVEKLLRNTISYGDMASI